MPEDTTTTAAPTQPSSTNAPSAAPVPDSGPSQELFAPRDIRNSPQFRKIWASFEKRAKPTGTVDQEPPKQESHPKPEEHSEATTNQPEEESAEIQEESTAEDAAESEQLTDQPEVKPAAADKASLGKGKKSSPWRVADHWKKKAQELEQQLVESRKGAIPETQAKEYTERITKAEARVKELEDEIKFVNYEKSREFQEKYHEPYARAFARAVQELSEVQVTDPEGHTRPATPEDILGLISLPLGRARELADAMFGAFADDAMAHRKEIKTLFDQRQSQLEKAKTDAGEHEKQVTEQRKQLSEKIHKDVSEIWTKSNQAILADPNYKEHFVPRDGDEEWNKRLKSGYDLADKAFSDPNPRDPRLTPEQRLDIIERHAAIRNRAAAFGPLRYENKLLRKSIENLKKELDQFKSSEPTSAGSSKVKPTPPESGYTLDRVFESLRKRAK